MLSSLVTNLFPQKVALALTQLSAQAQEEIEELRIHNGAALRAVTAQGDYIVAQARDYIFDERDIMLVLERATGGSIHTALPSLKNGFISLQGGHRLGVCGCVVLEHGGIANFREPSSLNLRIAHEYTGISQEVMRALLLGDELANTLIISPPGRGKTTLLRDILRSVSEGEFAPPARVGVADERGELCGMVNGIAQMDIGRRSDVITGCPKAQALMMLLRGMSPQVLAMDEITASSDIDALEQAMGCGVKILATAHAASFQDFMRRPIYKRLVEAELFERMIQIDLRYGKRVYTVLDGRGEACCNFGAHSLSQLG